MKQLAPRTYTFAEYELDLTRRLLVRDGGSIPLHAKAFDLLQVLIENRERVIAKEELMELVWQDQFVEEANLTVQISALRKALGERKDEHRFIVTVPGRGYRFVANVRDKSAKADSVPDIVIETHTTSRVLMEEEVLTEPETKSVIDTSLVSVTPKRLATSQDYQVGTRNRTYVAWLAGILALLFVASMGFWFYQSRKRNKQLTASIAPPQITMRRFTTTAGMPYRVAISPDGKSLVYLQRFKGKDSLWLGQIETNSSVQINQPSHGRYGSLVFAPDGDNIYFTVQDDKHPQWTLLRMPAVGGVVTELIRNVHSSVTFSPDGRQLAFIRVDDETNQTAIVVASATDGQQERMIVTQRAPEIFSSDGLSWAPDGQTIAVAAVRADKRQEILAVSVADGSTKKIAERDWGSVGNLVWLADASGLLTIAQEDFSQLGGGQVWLVTYPDGAARSLTHDVSNYQLGFLSVSANGKAVVLRSHANPEIWLAPDGDVKQARLVLQGNNLRDEGRQGLTWTPDGRLLYTAYVGESQTIWAMNADGGNQQQLTPAPRANSIDNQMSVTANGRYMVFHSNRSGSSEIWRSNTDGSDLRQLTTGGGNSQPSLSPDGKWIVYALARDGKSTVWRISIEGGSATQLSHRQLAWPEVSPDGKLVACKEPTTLPRSPVTVIQFAGGEPLKSFAVPQSAFLARRLRWTPDGTAIMYQDSFQGLWRQALDEEQPEPVSGFDELHVSQFVWSPDGKSLTYTTSELTREIILIENFK